MFHKFFSRLVRSKLLIVILALIAAILIYQFHDTIYVGDAPLEITRAVSNEERQVGLLGYNALAENHGILFVFDNEGRYPFHMVGMKFAIDFIWISGDGTIVDITPDAQPQLANVPNDKVKFYWSALPAKYVIEVNAGWARRHNVRVGTHVSRL